MVTESEIENARTPNGGWTRETLEGWGVPWPPPKGWKADLIKNGTPQPLDDKKTRAAIRRLTGFLGAQGCKTAGMSSAQIVREAMAAFGIDHEHEAVRVAEIVNLMGLPERNKAVAEYVTREHPKPSTTWPSTAKARWAKPAIPRAVYRKW